MKLNIAIARKSDSLVKNYARYLAKISLYFKKLPTEIEPAQINEYLYFLTQERDTPSESYFKFTVFSLRFIYRIYGMEEKRIALPSIKQQKTLPVVLSKDEIKRLLSVPSNQKHRILLLLLYGCGLRCGEVRSIEISDLDFDRRMLHVRNSKGRKDRYVPLDQILIGEIKYYIEMEKPTNWLFNGKTNGRAGGDFDNRYSQKGVQWVVQQTAKTAGILKKVNVHTLRHTFATHLLEDGLDIVSIKELLGHAHISTTIVYLHVAQFSRMRSYSPLATLYGHRKSNDQIAKYCIFQCS